MSASAGVSGGNGGVESAFGGLGSMSTPGGNHTASALESVATPTTATQKPQEDLLGLF